MFWACSVSGGRKFDLKSSAKDGELLHVSHAVLNLGSGEGLVTLFITQGLKKFPVGYLDKSKPMTSLDLYFDLSQEAVFSVEGKGEVSLLGYFEPTDALSGPGIMEADSDTESSEGKFNAVDEESDEEEEEVKGKTVPKVRVIDNDEDSEDSEEDDEESEGDDDNSEGDDKDSEEDDDDSEDDEIEGKSDESLEINDSEDSEDSIPQKKPQVKTQGDPKKMPAHETSLVNTPQGSAKKPGQHQIVPAEQRTPQVPHQKSAHINPSNTGTPKTPQGQIQKPKHDSQQKSPQVASTQKPKHEFSKSHTDIKTAKNSKQVGSKTSRQ